jgi:hypothetical protein
VAKTGAVAVIFGMSPEDLNHSITSSRRRDHRLNQCPFGIGEIALITETITPSSQAVF